MQTLESNHWIGAQGNRLWIGQVEGDGHVDIIGEELVDYSEANRVKVRIMGYHERERGKLKPEELPWAHVMMPTTETPSRRGSGATHGLLNGTWVLGTFLDGESAQQPIVMGALGIIEKKNQNYANQPGQTGLSNDFEPYRPETIQNNLPADGQAKHGPSNRGSNVGQASKNDERQSKDEEQTLSVANAKCGPRPESDIARILNDLFKYAERNENFGSTLVDKTTGNITSSLEIISTYTSRLGAVAQGLLGSVKQLILDELRKYFEKFILKPVTDALTLAPQKKPEVIWATTKVMDTIWEIIKCIFKTVFEKLLEFLFDIVSGLLENLLNAALCVISDIIQGIVNEITGAIETALDMIKNAVSIIQVAGDFGGSLVAKLGALIAQFCDGNLSCFLGTGEFSTKEGDKPDNAIETLFNRMETFSGLPDDLNVGLYGEDSFFSSLNGGSIIGPDGKVVSGTLDCSRANRERIPAFPTIHFTGHGKGQGDDRPRAIPAVSGSGVIVGVVITNPGGNVPGICREPRVAVTPYAGYGRNARLKAIVNNCKLTDVIVINGGGGYPYFDGSVTNTEVPTDDDGNPDYDKVFGVFTENPTWLGIITTNNPPVVLNAGENLDESCGVIIEPASDEQAEVVLPELKPNIVNGRLLSIEVVKEGFGFTKMPKIYLGCNEGSVGVANSRRAIIKPSLRYIARKDAKLYLSDVYDRYQHIIDCVGHPGE